MDESTYEPVRDYFQQRGGKAMGKDHPIARINIRSLETPFGRKHIIEAIRWAARE